MFTGDMPALGHRGQANASAANIKDQVRKLPTGAFIEVRVTNKTKVRGYLSSVDPDGFSLKEGSTAAATARLSAT